MHMGRMRFGVTLNATVYEGTDAGEYLILIIAFTINDLIKATLKSHYELYNLDFHKKYRCRILHICHEIQPRC